MSLPLLTANLLVATALPLAPPSVTEWIRAGEAGRAYQLLTEELDDGRTDRTATSTAFLADLLRYLRCEDLATPVPATRDAEADGTTRTSARSYRHARDLLDIDLLRLARRQRERQPSGPMAWLKEKRLSWEVPSPAADERRIEWPAESERWSDEDVVVAPPELRCGLGPRRESERTPTAKELLLQEAEAARSLRLRTPAGSPARVALLLDETVLRARLADWPEVWVLVKLVDAERLERGAGELAAVEQAELALLSGLAAEHDHQEPEALERWNRAADLSLPPEERLFVDLHRQRWLVAFGRTDEARALLDSYTNVPGTIGRYLRYRLALVRFRTGDEAGLLAVARELLGRKSAVEVAADPVGRATEELVYLQLARHPFSPSQVEVVESLGVVREIHRRMEALGTVALEHGRPLLAVDVFRWLLENNPLKYSRPYYLGRLAAAAAAHGDAPTFQSAFTSLVDEGLGPLPPPLPVKDLKLPKHKKDPIDSKVDKETIGRPKRKAKRRNIEWDRQLLLATRDSLSVLVARRDFSSLRVLVDELQKYLRVARNPPPYAELMALYRLASTQLPTGPRAYAEKVGAARAAVWLGEITLDRPQVEVPEPEIELPRLLGPVSLLCLPDDRGGCPRWLGPERKAPPSPAPTKTAPPREAHAS